MSNLISIVFSAINPKGHYTEFVYSDSDLGACLDQLSLLVASGWRLVCIKCVYGIGPYFTLPVEAFDGTPFKRFLSQLQQEWEALLL